MTAGTNKEADIATPTSERILPPNTDNATPAPDANAIETPTHKLRVKPLNEEYKVVYPQIEKSALKKRMHRGYMGKVLMSKRRFHLNAFCYLLVISLVGQIILSTHDASFRPTGPQIKPKNNPNNILN